MLSRIIKLLEYIGYKKKMLVFNHNKEIIAMPVLHTEEEALSLGILKLFLFFVFTCYII